jgi:peptide/nickel transport system substrate-binding protein
MKDLSSLLETSLSRRTFARIGASAGLLGALGVLYACEGGAPDASDDTDDEEEPAAPDADDADDSDEPADGEPRQGGTLVWGMGGDADALDPHTAGAWAAWRQTTMIYEGLVRIDLHAEEGTPGIEAQLAESWEVSDDGLTWTFDLRQGVQFHDGSDFDADAVYYNYERVWVEDSPQFFANARPRAVYAFQFLDDVEVIDDYTISFTHAQPVGEFLRLIGDYYFFGIISPARLDEVGNEELPQNGSGTGPFRFVERSPGERTVFERNDDYWGRPPYVDRLIVRPILEDQARVVALQTGELDLMSDPPPDTIDSLVNDGYVLSMGDAPHVTWYYFHFRNEHGSNQLVRQAVSHAINREAIATQLFRDTAAPAYGILSPGMPAYDPDYKPFDYDPDRARELLEEAGYPDGFSTKLLGVPTASGWPQAGAVAEMMQTNLADVGIELELELVEWITFLGQALDRVQRTDAMLYGTAWGMPFNFFLNIISESVYRTEEANPWNWYNYRENPREDLDEKLQAGAMEIDIEAGNEHYREAHRQIVEEDIAFLPITHDKLPHLMRPEVKGFIHSVNMNYDMTTVWLDE